MTKIDKLIEQRGQKVMRILHISSAVTWRGGENQILLLINGLLGITQNFLLCPSMSPLINKVDASQTSIFTFNKKFGISISASRLIKKICSKHKIDIIHVHDSHAHTFAFGSSLIGNHTPIVLTRRVDFKPSYIGLFKYNSPSIKKIVCVSNKIEHILKTRVFNKKRLTTIYSGINLSKNGSAKNLREALSLDKNKVIGFIGAFVDHKDPISFVHMAQLIIKDHSDYHFIMVGQEGDQSTKVEEEIRKNSLNKFISIIGFTHNMDEIWNTLDALVITSKMEGLGSVALEAFYHEVPLISTNAGGLEEIVKHEMNGLVSEIGNVKMMKQLVEYLFDKNQTKDKLVVNAKEYVQMFSHHHMAKSYLKIYQEVLN